MTDNVYFVTVRFKKNLSTVSIKKKSKTTRILNGNEMIYKGCLSLILKNYIDILSFANNILLL